MEAGVRVRICLRMGIMLFFFYGTGLSEHSSTSNERYIMESYFEKHERLLDSEFQDFIAHQVHCGSDMLPSTLYPALSWSIKDCNLIGEGSHRLLSLSLTSENYMESSDGLPAHSCEVIVIERLPSGIFADPFELQHLLQRGAFTDVTVFGDTNLELPSVRSNRSVVEVHIDTGAKNMIKRKNEVHIQLELPLHSRYPPLDESGYSDVKLSGPDLFMRCTMKEKLEDQSCLINLAIDSTKSESCTVKWRMPSGIKAHATLVSFGTFIAAFSSALLIVIASIFYSDIKSSKDLKQS